MWFTLESDLTPPRSIIIACKGPFTLAVSNAHPFAYKADANLMRIHIIHTTQKQRTRPSRKSMHHINHMTKMVAIGEKVLMVLFACVLASYMHLVLTCKARRLRTERKCRIRLCFCKGSAGDVENFA